MKKKLFILSLLVIANNLKAQQINTIIRSTPTAPAATTVDKVFVFGVGNTDALNLDKLTASGGLSLALKPNQRITLFLSFNYGGTVVKKEKSDSVQLSSLYFPDIASTAFTGSFEYAFAGFRKRAPAIAAVPATATTPAIAAVPMIGYKTFLQSFTDNTPDQLLFSFEGSVQGRNIQKDTITYNLSVANINAGLKYKFIYQPTSSSNSAVFILGVCYNGVFINANSKKSFDSLFKDENNTTASSFNTNNLDGSINGWSILTSVQLNKVILYFRTFDDLDRAHDLGFSVGIKATGNFISF
jgi:hypothetical protein